MKSTFLLLLFSLFFAWGCGPSEFDKQYFKSTLRVHDSLSQHMNFGIICREKNLQSLESKTGGSYNVEKVERFIDSTFRFIPHDYDKMHDSLYDIYGKEIYKKNVGEFYPK